MGFLSGVTDALFGDPNRSVNANQAQNKRAQEFVEEQTELARGESQDLYKQSFAPLNAGYQSALDALGGALKQQIDTTARGNYFGQQALLAGMPQFQNAILGLPVDNTALQPTILHPERNLDFLFNPKTQYTRDSNNPFFGVPQHELNALKALAEQGWTEDQLRAVAGPEHQTPVANLLRGIA